MPGGLVEPQAAARPLADEQERAVALDDGGDGDGGTRGGLLDHRMQMQLRRASKTVMLRGMRTGTGATSCALI